MSDPGLYDASRYSPEQIAAYKADNERRVRDAARKGDAFVDGLPLKVTLELTADCNLYCRMCEFPVPREQGRGRYDLHMPVETFRMLAPQVFPHARIVNLTVVGEPLMVPYLDEVLDECAKWQTRLELISNVVLLDGPMLQKVGPHLGCLIVSFDGGTRRTFNRIRVGSDFEQVTRNMLRFARWRETLPPDRRPGFHLAVTLMKENAHELPTIVRIAKLLGADLISAAWMIAFNDKLANSSLLRHRPLANRALRDARRVAAELGMKTHFPVEFPEVTEAELEAVTFPEPSLPDGPLPHLKAALAGGPVDEVAPAIPEGDVLIPLSEVGGLSTDEPIAGGDSADARRLRNMAFAVAPAEPPTPDLGSDGKPRNTCKFLWNELFVNVSGDVAPCCIQGRPVVGSTQETNLSEIWNNEPMKEMRQRLLDGDPIPCCKDCNYNTQLGQGAYREDTYFIDLNRKV